MSDRAVVFLVLICLGLDALAFAFGAQFIYWSFFDPNTPFLEQSENAKQIVLFITGMMGSALTVPGNIATALIVWKVSTKSVQAGSDAALSTPDNIVRGGVVQKES